MLVSIYKRFLTIFFIISLFLLALGIILSLLIMIQPFSYEKVGINLQQFWWFFYGDNSYHLNDEIWPMMGILLFSGISLGLSFYLRVIYKKSASLEVFFFSLFLFFICFENLRILVFYLNFLNNPTVVNLVVIQILYFGRFGALFSLLFSSLFAVELKFHKIGIIIWIIVGISFLLAYIISLNGSIYLANLIYKLNDEKGLFILTMFIYVFIMSNWVVAFFIKNNRYLLILLSCFLFLIGREFLLFSVSPIILLLGLLAFFIGVLQFSRQLDRLYIWG